MHLGRRAGLALVMVVAACEAKAPPLIESARAVTAASSTRVLVPRGAVWSWSATGGCCSTYTDAPAPIGYGETYLATTIPSGSDPAHKPITVYFMKDIAIADATSIVGLHFDMMVDDGIVVYLNGHEVARHNMPAGAITPTTLALPHEAQNTYERVDLDVANLQFFGRGNTMRLSAEVHQADSASSDLVFDLSLVADTSTAAVPPAAPTKGGIPRGSVWSYWDRGGDLGPSYLDRGGDTTVDWRTTTTLIGFAEGAGPLGYGENYLATTVGYAGPLQRKNLTTYFRKDFVGLSGYRVKSITAELMYDDGVVFYLNGQKLVSYSMPAGETTPDTRAFDHEANNTYEVFDWTPFKHQFYPGGSNTLAVEVHQTAATSSDIVFDLALHIEPLATPTIAHGGLWRYWDGGGDLGTAWRESSYDDSRWTTATGPLGYGEDYLTSTVSFGADANHKRVTTYFRKKFHVEDATLVRGIRGDWMYDDGLVVYVNGHELVRAGMPAGPITAATYAPGHEANGYEHFEAPVPAGWLTNGDNNQIAVEVHQASDASSDLVFDGSIEVLSDPIFDRSATNPVVVPAGNPNNEFPYPWNAQRVGYPAVLHLPDGTWVLYYSGNDGYQSGGWMVGRATSADGVHWTFDAEPVAFGVVQGLDYDGTTYRMWWVPHPNSGGSDWFIYLATSIDGVHWTTDTSQSLVPDAYEAAVIHDGNRYLMWSDGHSGKQLSQSPDGLTWTEVGPFVGILPTTVLKDPSGTGYIGWGNDGWGNIVHETSPDGLVWTADNTSLAAAGQAWVVRDGTTLRMWYTDEDVIGQATSR